MNLSSRLDAARRQREQGQAKGLDPHPLDLRYVAKEGQTYDGTELRTGEELTPEKWEELRRRDEALPTWKRETRGGESFADSADLIDLTQVGPAQAPPPPPPGPEIELPVWARDEAIVVPSAPEPRPRDAGSGSCANCGGEPRVDVLDMLSGVAHLECTGCGFKWQAATEHRRWPGRT
jgi:hypothetical protein